MPKEHKDRDAIVTKAIGIESVEERAAYIDQACDELKHQVEEQVAEHFEHEDEKESSDREGKDSRSSERASEQSRDKQKDDHERKKSERKSPEKSEEKHAGAREEMRTVAREHPRMTVAWALLVLVLLVAAVGGAGVAVWEWREAKKAHQSEQQAVEKRDQAQKDAEKAKGKLKRAVDTEKERANERDQAKEAEKAAKHAEEESKAILFFIKHKLLATGRPGDVSLAKAFWAGSRENKDAVVRKGITLRQAVDEAEAQVTKSFADRPQAEASVREMLGFAYLNLGEAEQAVKQYERALALWEETEGPNHPNTADCLNQLAVAYRLAGRDADAARLYHRNPNSPAHAYALFVRGSTLLSQKKPAEAEGKLRECLTIRQQIQADDWTTFETQSLLGEALLQQKKYTEAESSLLSGYEGMKKRKGKIPSSDKTRFTQAIDRLVNLYQEWGKQDKATKWRKELETAKES